jgi:hypothetical protein
LIEIEDTLEMREAPALLEPSLFRDTNKISLPRQVNLLTEDNLKNALWYALEDFEGGVYGEVNLGKGYGRVDLLCENFRIKGADFVLILMPVRVGIECKNTFLENIGKKDFGYANSPVLNALYFASFAVGYYEFSLDYIEAKIKGRKTVLQLSRWIDFGKRSIEMRGGSFEDVIHMHRVGSDNKREMKKQLESLRVEYREGIDIPPYGVILYNPLGEMWVASGAQELIHYTPPPAEEKIKPAKEAVINYSVWKYFKNMNYILAAECELPRAVKFEVRKIKRKTRDLGGIRLPPGMYVNGYVSTTTHTGHYTIDITAMPKSCVNETNPSKLEITGVECKPSTSDRNLSELKAQLPSYQNSGDLSCLYVAVPKKYEREIKEFLKEQKFTNVGILTVGDKGEVEEIKEAKELELKKPDLFEIEKRKVEDGRFKERLYCEFLNQVF